MGEIEWNVGWKNGKSGVGWMPDDAIKNQRPRQMRRRLWKCVSDFVLEVLKIAEKRSAYTSCRSSSMRLMIGEREGGGGIWNAEFGIRNQGRRDSTAYRRAQGSALYKAEITIPIARIPSRAGKRRFPSMEDAHTEARYMRRSCRARFGLWRARPMKHCEYSQIAAGW